MSGIFDESELRAALARLEYRGHIAFAAAGAERFVGLYERFVRRNEWGDITMMRESIALGWRCAHDGRAHPELVAQAQAAVTKVTPDSEDFADVAVTGAIDSATAIYAMLDCCAGRSLDNAVRTGLACRRALHMEIRLTEDIEASRPGREQLVARHPIMLRELSLQQKSLELLLQYQALHKAELESFRAEVATPIAFAQGH